MQIHHFEAKIFYQNFASIQKRRQYTKSVLSILSWRLAAWILLMTSSISFIFWVIKTLPFWKYFQLKLETTQTKKKKWYDFTFGGHLYGQHDLSLDSEESGIINRKGFAHYSSDNLLQNTRKWRTCKKTLAAHRCSWSNELENIRTYQGIPVFCCKLKF
jgi:hypothetical protein